MLLSPYVIKISLWMRRRSATCRLGEQASRLWEMKEKRRAGQTRGGKRKAGVMRLSREVGERGKERGKVGLCEKIKRPCSPIPTMYWKPTQEILWKTSPGLTVTPRWLCLPACSIWMDFFSGKCWNSTTVDFILVSADCKASGSDCTDNMGCLHADYLAKRTTIHLAKAKL